MRLKGTLARAENIRALAAQDFTHHPPTVPRLPHELLEGGGVRGPRENDGVGFFTPQIALILKLLRSGEERRVDERRAERGSDAAHRLAHGGQKGGAGVFHQMPAIGDLKRAGKRLAGGERETAAAITCDNDDLRLFAEPFLRCRGLPIRE